MFGSLLGWYTIYTFGGLLPLREFCQLQNSLCVQVLRSPILAALLHDTRAVGVSQTLQRGKRNGITELSQTAPPVFGMAAITLGIGRHSSYGRRMDRAGHYIFMLWFLLSIFLLSFSYGRPA